MKAPSKNYINLILALGFGIVWAFFWALDRTLAYVLFGGMCFFFVLFFYNRFASTDVHSGNYDRSGSRQSYQSRASLKSNKSQPKPIAPGSTPSIESLKGIAFKVVVITLTVLGAAFFYFIWNISNSQPDLYPYDAYSKAEEFYALKQYDSAYFYYRYACNNDEALDEAWLGLGNTHYMQLQYDSALYFYKKASEADDEAFQPKYSIAWWYYARQQYQQSIDEISLFQTDYAQQADLWQLLGDNYYELGKYDEALPNYEQAYAIGSRSRWLCHVMAYLYDKRGDMQKAVELYKEALTFDNDLVEIHTRLGELLLGTEGESYRRRAAELQLSKGK
jgi:lipopolysaccharide biosynthesis regulator YciM